MNYYQKRKLSKAHKKRAAIELVIGHLNNDHRLNKNFYKRIVGDKINIMLAAAAFNLKRMMNKWKSSFWLFFENGAKTLGVFINLVFNPKNPKFGF